MVIRSTVIDRLSWLRFLAIGLFLIIKKIFFNEQTWFLAVGKVMVIPKILCLSSKKGIEVF